jgi:3-hydroxyisobutyrate dehydrogenase-like beta-hydroxyacid dehydrogenase
MKAEKIGFIGLGEMGLPMAINLQKAGDQVYAFDIENSRCVEAAKYGVVSCPTPKDVARIADKAIISIVRNYKQTESIIFSDDGILASGKKGLSIIIMSTLDPPSMKSIEEKLVNSGNYVIDAPVSGAKSGAEAATLTIMAAGPERIVSDCQHYFKNMGKNIFYFGPAVGAGQAAKLANNLVLAINMVAFTEGMRFAQENNISPNDFCKMINVSSGNSWVSQNWGAIKFWYEQYKPNQTLDIVYKDLFAIMKTCSDSHYSLPLGGLTFHLLMDAWKI